MFLPKTRKRTVQKLFIVLNILFLIISASGYATAASGAENIIQATISPDNTEEASTEADPSIDHEGDATEVDSILDEEVLDALAAEDELPSFAQLSGASDIVTFTSSEELNSPQGIVVGSNGKLLVANGRYLDNDEWANKALIRQFNSDGTFNKPFGKPENQTYAIAADDQGVYTYDNYGIIHKYDVDGNELNRFGEYFYGGRGIAVDGQSIYVLNDGDNPDGSSKTNIEKYNKADGAFVKSWGSDVLSRPSAIAVDHNSVYILDANEILKFDKDGNSETTVADGLSFPSGLALDAAGNIYVVDTNNNQIKKFASDGTLLNTWGSGPGSGVGQFKYPKGIALDKEGNIYVSDPENNRIQFLNPPPSVVNKEAKAGVIDNTNPDHSTVEYTINIDFSEAISLSNPESITLSDGEGYAAVNAKLLGSNTLEVHSQGGLKSNHPYTLTIPRDVIRDIGGSPLESDFIYPFTTQDVTPPAALSTSPVNQAEDVTIDKRISITFSKNIQSSDNFGSIKLEDSNGNSVNIQAIINHSILTLNHQDLLAYSTAYKVTIPVNAVKDTVGIGNPLTREYSFGFTTANQDVTPPTVTATSPSDAAKDVAVTAEFQATFSENIQPGDQFSMIKLKKAETETGITVSVQEDGIVSIKPDKSLDYGSTYVVTIPAGAVKDIEGNALAEAYTSTFTTIDQDVTPPTVKVTNPSNGASDVAVNQEITMTFSESIQLDQAKSILLKNAAGSIVAAQSSVRIGDSATVVLKPAEQLDYLAKYEVTIPEGAVADESGNKLQVPVVFTFKTQPNPYVGASHYQEILMPNNTRFEGIAVDQWGNVYATSSDNSTFNINKYGVDGKLVSTIKNLSYPGRLVVDSAGNLYVHDSSDIKKFDKNGKLAAQFSITDSYGGIATDQAGNIYVTSISNNNVVKYSSKGDKLATWGSNGEANGQFKAPVALAIDKAGFIFVADRDNKRIQKLDATGNYVTSWKISEADYYWGPSPSDVSVDSFGNVYVVANNEKNLLLQYDNNGKFMKTIGKKKAANDTSDGKIHEYVSPTTARVDGSNNLYLLDSTKKRIQFIDMSPQIVQLGEILNPKDVGGNMTLDYTFSLIFNEIVSDNNGANLKLLNDKNEPVPVTYRMEDNLLEIQAANLKANSRYRLVVPANAVKDSMGQTMDSEFSRIIYTQDTMAPFVERVEPGNKVLTDAASTIKLIFNESIKQGSAFDQITLKRDDEELVDIESSISGNELTVRPRQPLAYEHTYELTIPAQAIVDASGLSLENKYSLALSVRKLDKAAPLITHTDPEHGTINIPLNKDIVLTFDKGIQAGEMFKVIALLNGERPIAIDRSISGNTVTLKPRGKLEKNSHYKVIIPANAVTDLSGNNFAQKYTLQFTTENTPIAPYVVSSSPDIGAAQVKIDQSIVITFSEPVELGDAEGRIELISDSIVIDTELTFNGETLRITPRQPLNYGTGYELIIPQAAVKSLSGTVLSESFRLPFTTEDVSELHHNANLQALGIVEVKVVNGQEEYFEYPLTPSFSPNITSYTARVPSQSPTLLVVAVAEDEQASIAMTSVPQSESSVLVLVTVTAHDQITTKTYRILATIDNKPTDGGGSTGGGSGSSTGGGSTPYFTLKAEVDANKAISDALSKGKEVIISLTNDPDSKVQLSSSSMKTLIDKKKPLILENGGVRLTFASASLAGAVEQGSNLELGIRILKQDEKQTALQKAALGESAGVLDIGGIWFELTAQIIHADGTKTPVMSFKEPVAITVDLSAMKLSEADIAQLTGVRYVKDDKGNLTLVKLGGTYNTLNKSFTFYTDHFSLYGVIKAKSLTQIRLKLNELHTTVNGVKKSNDVAPIVVNDRTMVPARFIAENLGAEVLWNEETKEVTIKLDGKTLTLTVDKLIEGFDTAPKVVNDRVLVPIRYISEYFGANVLWYPSSETVEIVK